MKKLIFPLMLALLSVACEQDEYYLYKDAKRLQFGPDISRIYQSSYNLVDTLKTQTFYYSPQKVRDTVYFDLYAIGGTSAIDRPFVLRQAPLDQPAENAIPNLHYVAFDNPEVQKDYVIPAGTVHKKVPIYILKEDSMKEKTFTLKFEIVENEHFSLGESTNLWRKVQITDRLSMPNAWKSTFGNYSVRKHQFMIDETHLKWDDDFLNNLEISSLDYYRSIFQIALIAYNKDHEFPLHDENGVEITF